MHVNMINADLPTTATDMHRKPVPWGAMDHCAARCLAVRKACP